MQERTVEQKPNARYTFLAMTRHGQLEDRITKAAEKLFAQEGFAATGMRAIARVARVSIGAIYHHFKNKEEILESIVREEIKRRQQALDVLRAQGLSLQKQIQEIIALHFDLLCENSDVARLFFRERFDPSPVSKRRVQDLYSDVAEYIAGVIREGLAKGEIRSCQPLLTAYTILGMVEAVSLRALGEDETAGLFMKEGPEELARSIWFWLHLGQEERKADA
ncbi:TetR/AcrR family transcriptional regulator [Candidatus Bipolaricaulota bacterium]|nr:TetR/AcrR family transcriptional regulator [Candidatus Bipolaricaulota bacterium]